jgi:hypothetical protein
MTKKIDAQIIVDKLLPQENFFAFKNSKDMAKELKAQELKSIENIIEAIRAHGNYVMTNIDDAYLQPILSTNDSRDHVINALIRVIESCKHQTTKAICDYQAQSGGQTSKELGKLFDNIDKIQSKFLTKIKSKPFCL